MSITLIWLVLALVFVCAEMLLGTLYLFALSLGSLMAGLVSFLGFSLDAQGIIAGVVTIIGAVGFYFLKRKKKHQDSDDNFDIGQVVLIEKLNDDGSATVNYRGASWQAVAKNGVLTPGYWSIDGVRGIQLVLNVKVRDIT